MANFLTSSLLKVLYRLRQALENFDHIQKLKMYNKIGSSVNIQKPYCHTSPEKITIGNNVSFAAFVHIWGGGGVEIGDNCMIASHCAITSVTHNPKQKLFLNETVYKSVKIGNNVWIGTHSVIFPGITIEDNVIIGAGSIVNKNLEGNAVYAGVPCKLLYKLDKNETENKRKH